MVSYYDHHDVHYYTSTSEGLVGPPRGEVRQSLLKKVFLVVEEQAVVHPADLLPGIPSLSGSWEAGGPVVQLLLDEVHIHFNHVEASVLPDIIDVLAAAQPGDPVLRISENHLHCSGTCVLRGTTASLQSWQRRCLGQVPSASDS